MLRVQVSPRRYGTYLAVLGLLYVVGAAICVFALEALACQLMGRGYVIPDGVGITKRVFFFGSAILFYHLARYMYRRYAWYRAVLPPFEDPKWTGFGRLFLRVARVLITTGLLAYALMTLMDFETGLMLAISYAGTRFEGLMHGARKVSRSKWVP